MKRRFVPISVVLASAALLLASCGGTDGHLDKAQFTPRFKPSEGATRGGELRVLASGDMGPLDPGQVLNQATFMIAFATQRTLLATSPDHAGQFIPDLAAQMPEVDIAEGTIEVKIRDGVQFSPPVDREVRSDDIKYAIERALTPGVANGELGNYLGSLVGFEYAQRSARRDPHKVPEITGISCPSEDTIRFRFEGKVPPLAVAALALPATAPVPRAFASPHDRSIPSVYGEHVVSTGPYMVDRDEEGVVTGYEPGRSITMVRNPNWDPETDFRPAFLDRIEMESGYTNLGTASNTILAGASMVNGDFSPPPMVLERAATMYPEQLTVAPSTAVLYASLNTRVPPFNSPDVRRAVVAAADRNAMRLAVGGAIAGDLATHFLPPEINGFEQAGGVEGPGLPFLSKPAGDLELAADYMRSAGYPEGTYDGDERPVMVTDTTSEGRRFGEIMRQTLASLGIEVDVVIVSRDTMYSSYCNVPSKHVGVCPNVGWVGQFGDGQTVLDQTFNGAAIVPVNNSNWPLLDVPFVNDAIDQAKDLEGVERRAEAWGKADRQITALAPAVPILWRDVAFISSSNVETVLERNATTLALPMISVEEG